MNQTVGRNHLIFLFGEKITKCCVTFRNEPVTGSGDLKRWSAIYLAPFRATVTLRLSNHTSAGHAILPQSFLSHTVIVSIFGNSCLCSLHITQSRNIFYAKRFNVSQLNCAELEIFHLGKEPRNSPRALLIDSC